MAQQATSLNQTSSTTEELARSASQSASGPARWVASMASWVKSSGQVEVSHRSVDASGEGGCEAAAVMLSPAGSGWK